MGIVCVVCSREVEADAWGRDRKFHPECRGAGRSLAMKGNQNAAGKRSMTAYEEADRDLLKVSSYATCTPETIRAVAVSYWGELARFSYWCYDRLNPYFGNRIAHPLFQFCRVMPYGMCVGLSYTGDPDRPVIDVFRSMWERRRKPHGLVCGIIAHEMLHFYVTLLWREQGTGWYKTSHANEWWPAEVRRLSPLLGVDLESMDDPFGCWPDWSGDTLERIDLALRQGDWPF